VQPDRLIHDGRLGDQLRLNMALRLSSKFNQSN
jgi:hypothetical protein